MDHTTLNYRCDSSYRVKASVNEVDLWQIYNTVLHVVIELYYPSRCRFVAICDGYEWLYSMG
jgi:hypothetical protein